MSITYGFFNAKSHDRQYTAEQVSMIFDGIIADGVYKSIGTALIVTAKSGMTVNVGIGRAWFNHTWTYNDSILPLTVPNSDVLLPRYDAVVIEINADDSVRANTIKIISGTAASSPSKPAMTSTEKVHQYPLAYIYVGANVTSISQSNIQNCVGTSACPFVKGVLESVSTNQLVQQWEAQFSEWFSHVKNNLSSDVAGNLQNEIDACMPKSGGTFTGNVFSNYEISDQYGKMFAANEYSAGSVKELIDKVRYTNGAAGSVSFSASSVISGYTIQAIWHNFIWIPHRTGGLNGKANNDNSNFGTLLLFPFSGSFLGYAIRLSTGSIDSCIPLSSVTKSFTLTSAGWSNSAQTITDGMITGTSNQEVIPAIGITKEQLIAFQNAMIVDAGQSSGSMTLKVMGTLPKIDIPIRVIFRGNI